MDVYSVSNKDGLEEEIRTHPIGVKRFGTALEVVFISMQITYPITYFPSNWNILTFFLPLFDLIRFILYYFVQAKLFHANLRFQKEKNFEETLCLQPRHFVSISLHLHL